MLKASKQQGGTLHNIRGPPRMMQLTCWEKACGERHTELRYL